MRIGQVSWRRRIGQVSGCDKAIGRLCSGRTFTKIAKIAFPRRFLLCFMTERSLVLSRNENAFAERHFSTALRSEETVQINEEQRADKALFGRFSA